ncbi:hypothetical protein ACFYUY_01375 [Kitasatospora sp. NPDC004745]|uniref:hypothetical protein n=1 Tax=Kitasatospora sp. NPDC004745 TaxID=3364019 RepID=UPI0036C6B320
MPLRLRAERRAFSRDAARHYASPNPGTGPSRAERRRHGWRGDVSALVHGPHSRTWLHATTPGTGGQRRVDAKRQARADFWHTVRIEVSAEIEPYFRRSLHLLHPKAQLRGRHPHLYDFAVDLDVHIPGAPVDAVSALPVFRSVHDGDVYVPQLDSITWRRADGTVIPVAEPAVKG